MTTLIGDGIPTTAIHTALTGTGPSATLDRLLNRRTPPVITTHVQAVDLIASIRGEFIAGRGGRHSLAVTA